MDKETLSNYGWIVICVLVLAVMLALATPFGTFVANAVKSTTQGLFDVNQNALNSTGLISMGDQVFENCDHLETELRNVTDTYTGDTCCKACGAVMSAGHTVKAKVPEGALYTTADGTVYNPGDELPETPTTGDSYVTEYYQYKYNCKFNYSSWSTDETQNGWGVRVTNTERETYGPILESINGVPITTLNYTFYGCSKMTSSPAIPSGVVTMNQTFYACGKLTTAPTLTHLTQLTSLSHTFMSAGITVAPAIPSCVTDMKGTFYNCSNLTDISKVVVPSGVTSLFSTFSGCKSLVDASMFVIPNHVPDIKYLFSNCSSLTKVPVIPNGVVYMDETFENCKAITDLSTLVIPSSVQSLYHTFQNCSSLVNAPDLSQATNVKEMYYLFENCTSLNGVIKIGMSNSKYDGIFENVDMSKITLTGPASEWHKQQYANTGLNSDQATIIS